MEKRCFRLGITRLKHYAISFGLQKAVREHKPCLATLPRTSLNTRSHVRRLPPEANASFPPGGATVTRLPLTTVTWSWVFERDDVACLICYRVYRNEEPSGVALALAGRSEATASRRHSKSLALRSFGSNGAADGTELERPPDLLHCALALLHCALGSSMRLRRQRSEAKLFACPGSLRSFARWSPSKQVDRLALSLGQVRRPARARPPGHSLSLFLCPRTRPCSRTPGASSVSVTLLAFGAQFHCSRARPSGHLLARNGSIWLAARSVTSGRASEAYPRITVIKDPGRRGTRTTNRSARHGAGLRCFGAAAPPRDEGGRPISPLRTQRAVNPVVVLCSLRSPFIS